MSTDYDSQSFNNIEKHLMESDNVAAVYLSPKEMEIRSRLSAGYSHWMSNPTTPDSNIITFLKDTFGISHQQAYRDLGWIKIALGNVRNAHKEWYRYVVIQMCQEAFELAKTLKDPKAMAAAADKLGKYTRCDQIDEDQLPWDQLIPPNFEPSNDVTVLGFQHDPLIEVKRKRMREKYLQKIEDVEIIG